MTDKDQYAMFLGVYELLRAQQAALDEISLTVEVIYKALCEKFSDFERLKNNHELEFVTGIQQRLQIVRLHEIDAIIASLKMASKAI